MTGGDRLRPRLALGTLSSRVSLLGDGRLLPGDPRPWQLPAGGRRRRGGGVRWRVACATPSGAAGPRRTPALLPVHRGRSQRRPVGLLAPHRGARHAPGRGRGRGVCLLGQHLRRTPRLRPRRAPHRARAPAATRHGRRAARRPRGVRDAKWHGSFAGLFALGLLLAPIFPLLIAETPAAWASGTRPTPSASRSRRRPSAPVRCPRSPASSPATPGSSRWAVPLAAILALLLLHERRARR